MKINLKAFFFFFSLLSILDSQAYWQQGVQYNIDVKLNHTSNSISAFSSMMYINNSPDTLDHIFMHLWPNAYTENTALAKQILEEGITHLYFGEKTYQGNIDSLDFKVNNSSVEWAVNSDYNDIARIQLKSDLLPGDSILISTPFRVKIPLGEVSRIGYLGESSNSVSIAHSFQLTQWYPKPAVYDTAGWHRMPYLSQGEFYSEFGSFNVNIKAHKDYTVAASGNLVETDKSGEYVSYKYTLKNVHDFAWFVDNQWVTEESEIQLPHSNRIVKTFSKYKASNYHLWENSVKLVDSAVYYYSLWIGDYPYDVCTAVDGGLTAGGGMEYPTITVIGDSENRNALEEVILHEVGHNWFYGILGSNERTFPWMDEGINSYYERRYYEEVRKDIHISDLFAPLLPLLVKDSIPPQSEFHSLMYDFTASRNSDQAINLPAPEYSSLNYGAIVYAKSAIAFNYLEKYLGKPVFDQCMRTYFNTWKFKHPAPVDLQNIFEKETGKDLMWFFDELLNTTGKIDYAIHSANFNEETKYIEVIVKNKGDISSPVVITAMLNGKAIKTIWYEGFNDIQTLLFPDGEYDEFVIDYYHDIPEINRSNNRLRLYNIFGKIEPFEATFFFNFEKNDKTQLYFSPITGYNQHDKLQLGFGVYNSTIKEKPFRFLLLPQYSFGTNRIVGSGKFTYSLYPDDDFQKINLNVFVKRQGLNFGIVDGQFTKKELEMDFIIANRNARSLIKSNFSVKLSQIDLEIDRRGSSTKNYLTFSYNLKNKKKINPYGLNLMAQAFDQNWKVQLESDYHLTLNKKLQTLDIRLFGGYFLENNSAGTERFRITAGNGSFLGTSDLENFLYNTHDYLFDQIMLGRFVNNSANLVSQQVYMNDGGFKSGVNPGLSGSWLTSANIVVPTPVKFIALFADIGMYQEGLKQYQDGNADSPILYDFGIQLNIVKNYFEIYLPLLYSKSIENNYETAGADKILNRIKFMFDINQLYNIYQ